jgi:hypothetical protein
MIPMMILNPNQNNDMIPMTAVLGKGRQEKGVLMSSGHGWVATSLKTFDRRKREFNRKQKTKGSPTHGG